MIRVGLAEVDITPTEHGRLGRLIAQPTQVTGVKWSLYARATVFDDNHERAAFLSVDMNFMFSQAIPEIRAVISEAGGIAPASIMVACTHTHNSFSVTPWHEDDDRAFPYLDYFKGFLPELIEAAVANLTPCRIAAGSVEAPGWTQNRRPMDPNQVDLCELCRDLYGHDFIFYRPNKRWIDVFTTEILGSWEFQRRSATRGVSEEVEVQVIRIGDAAIVGFAIELFCEVKHAIQAQSPFRHTFLASLTNGGHGYMPNRESFDHGGYETCVGISSQFIPEAADMVRDSALRQLHALAGVQ